MDNDVELTYEEEYRHKLKVSRKHKKIILLALSLMLALCLILYLVFLAKYPLPYDDLQLNVQEENGIIYIYATWTSDEGFIKGSISSTPIYLDYENDIDYREYHFQLSASNWKLLRYPGTTRLPDKFYPNGVVVDSESYVRHIDEDGIAHDMNQRYGRVYYDNPDGTSILLWECEDMLK